MIFFPYGQSTFLDCYSVELNKRLLRGSVLTPGLSFRLCSESASNMVQFATRWPPEAKIIIIYM